MVGPPLRDRGLAGPLGGDGGRPPLAPGRGSVLGLSGPFWVSWVLGFLGSFFGMLFLGILFACFVLGGSFLDVFVRRFLGILLGFSWGSLGLFLLCSGSSRVHG